MQYNMSPETLDAKFHEQWIKPKVTLVEDEDTPTKSELLQEKITEMIDTRVDDKTISGLRNANLTLTPNGALFTRKQKGFLPEIMESMYNDRVKYKKLMLQSKQEYEDTKDPKLLKDISKYDNIQMAKKISLNSAYGAIGNQYFRYYDLLIAEGITTAGQLSIRWIENKIN
jgi:DNA polymerase elongation subunit (family B)